jgi:hypothetical protein
MLNLIRPILARVVAALAGAFFAWLAARWKIDVDAATQAETVEAIVALMLAVWGVVYALAHKAINAWFNPADTATPALANKVLATRGERDDGDVRPTSERGAAGELLETGP